MKMEIYGFTGKIWFNEGLNEKSSLKAKIKLKSYRKLKIKIKIRIKIKNKN